MFEVMNERFPTVFTKEGNIDSTTVEGFGGDLTEGESE